MRALFKKKTYYILLILIWFLFIVAFVLCPLHFPFDTTFYFVILCIYLFAFFCFFITKKKTNFFDFDTILLSFCTIEHFIGFLYVGTEEFDRLFIQGIDTTLIIKGSLLASVGLISYMIGASGKDRDEMYIVERIGRVRTYKNISLVALTICFVMCYILFAVSGGFSFFESQYKEGVGSVEGSGRIFQAISLMTVFSDILCARLVLAYLDGAKWNVKMTISVLIVLTVALQLAMVGNRTIFSYLILPYIISYFTYIKKLDLKRTIIVMLMGVVGMYAIQIVRQGGDAFSTGVLSIFSDIIIPSRAYLGGFEYVEHNGFTFGVTLLHNFFELIPGLSSAIGEFATIGSAEAITIFLSDGSSNSGLGTTIIADIYIAFGIVGVILFMWALGRFVHSTWRNPLYDMIIQVSLFSCCVFMGRSAYFSPLRLIVWGILFCSVFVYLKNGKKNKSIVFPR